MRSIVTLMIVMLTLSAAHAAPERPNIIDPAGDAGPVAGGGDAFEWADLVAVWFEGETETEVLAKVEVAAASSATPVGEIAIRFTVGQGHFIAGWTNVAFPAPPFVFSGGFICTADADYNTDPADCTELADVSFATDIYTLPLSRDVIGAGMAGARIERLDAYAELYVDEGVRVALDATTEGTPYEFMTGPDPAADAPEPTNMPAGPEPSATAPTREDRPAAPSPVSEESPMPALAWFLLALVLFMGRRRAA